MKLLDRIRESRQKSVLPEEVKRYYQSGTKQRRGVAAFLAVGALLATVLVASAIFFGGRFAYDKIKGDDKSQKAGISQGVGKDQPAATGTQGSGEGSDNTQGQKPAPATPAPAPQSPSGQAKPTTPALGDEPLPHTGDEGM